MNFLNIVIALFVLGVGGASFAGGGDDSMFDLDPIVGADLVCGDDGGAIHVNTKEEKAWQGELDQNEGLPLIVTNFTRARCPNCFSFDAELRLFGQSVHLKVKTHNVFEKQGAEQVRKTVMTSEVLDDEDPETWVWDCPVVPAKMP